MSWPPLDDKTPEIHWSNVKYNDIYSSGRNVGVASKIPRNNPEPDYFRKRDDESRYSRYSRCRVDSSDPSDPVASIDEATEDDNENDAYQSLEHPLPETPKENGYEFSDFDTISSNNSSHPFRSLKGEDDRWVGKDIPLLHSPVRYKYYGRRRAHRSSIPFILLGPNVDHWKTTSQQLAARGFSVIVCELADDEEEEDKDKERISNNVHGDDDEGCNIILGLLEALRWTKAVVVGCENEAILAIQAALQLAPERVAGLVLCGDLGDVNRFVIESDPLLSTRTGPGTFAVDTFLREYIRCPFQVVWDGEAPPAPTIPPYNSDFLPPLTSNSHLSLGLNRSLIIGGGAAPHRKRPEQLAWVLTRFVEDRVACFSMLSHVISKASSENGSDGIAKNLTNPAATSSALQEFLSSGSLVVFGRYAASMLLYGTLIKVGIYQYENFRGGMLRVKSVYDMIWVLRGKLVGVVSSFAVNYGYIFKFLKGKPEEETEVFAKQMESDINTAIESNAEPESVAESESESESESEPEPDAETEDQEKSQDVEENNKTEGIAPFETSPEKQEWKPFRPTFFLDHVVA